MASSIILHNLCSISNYSATCYKSQTLALTRPHFLYSNSFLKLKKQSLLSNLQIKKHRTQKPRSLHVVFAAQSNFIKGAHPHMSLDSPVSLPKQLEIILISIDQSTPIPLRRIDGLTPIVLQTAWKVGKDGIEVGTSLVPDSVPRPVARISVTVVALTLSLFVLKSFLSTAFFVLVSFFFFFFLIYYYCFYFFHNPPSVTLHTTEFPPHSHIAESSSLSTFSSKLQASLLATMGLAYFIFIALNKDDRSRGSGGSTSKSTENRGSTATEEEALEEARRIMDKYK
ncbi:hypothetical protein EZV62_010947 [Acer yangbiense]|uniref:Uncharacterized protein n=1 Tax=Acer yangbiense TaxID=1000413 RepID=A0A5C7I354_9ROSI|nr:hypothetical protein EZV62_010947 [Acer yangbiense]